MYKYYKKYVPYLFLLPAGIILILFFFTNPTIPMIIKRIETINDI